jgi:hypothetical protein
MVQCIKGVIMVAVKVGAAVVQDSEAKQRLLDVAACFEAREGIRQGLDDARNGRTESAREFFERFEAARGH